VVMYVI